MKRMKVTIVAVLVALLIVSGFWWYWEQEMPLKALLPGENWHIATLVGIVLDDTTYTPRHVPYTVDEEAAQAILAALDRVQVNRCAGDDDFGFWLVLCSEGEHEMVSISVCENGTLVLNGDQYYEGGGEFYELLYRLAQTLSVSN